MNEVEKMYRNLGIKKIELVYPDNFKPFYPDFTAEKQIEILKALVFNNKAMSITQYYPHKQFCINNDMFIGIGEDFGEALAMFVNYLWQDLTEEERKQIKEILE